MEHTPMHSMNGRSRVYPELVKRSADSEQEAAYYAALELVARIDEELTRGIRHYRNKAGVLLTSLDQVVHAILHDDLQTPETQDSDIRWTTPQELAA